MLVEDYRIKDQNPSSSKEVALYDESYARLAVQLEMRTVAGFVIANKKADDAAVLFPELTGAELNTWRKFLPSASNLSQYSYDAPPVEALQAIADAQAMKIFDQIVIWSPQGNSGATRIAKNLELNQRKVGDFLASLDPMAVGVINFNGRAQYFPIVRWGEALLPYKKVKQRNAAVRAHIISVLFFIPLILVVLATAGIAAVVRAHGGWPVLEWAPLLLAVPGSAWLLGNALSA